MKIQTSHSPLGWHAWDEDTYDGAPEDVDCGSLSPLGIGDTEQEAIDDLYDQMGFPYSTFAPKCSRLERIRPHAERVRLQHAEPGSWLEQHIDGILNPEQRREALSENLKDIAQIFRPGSLTARQAN